MDHDADRAATLSLLATEERLATHSLIGAFVWGNLGVCEFDEVVFYASAKQVSGQNMKAARDVFAVSELIDSGPWSLLQKSAAILAAGWLGDRFGRRRVIVLAVIWFGVFTLLIASSESPQALYAARCSLDLALARLCRT